MTSTPPAPTAMPERPAAMAALDRGRADHRQVHAPVLLRLGGLDQHAAGPGC